MTGLDIPRIPAVEPGDLLRYLAESFEHGGLNYLVTGSMATIACGEPRFTNS